MVLLFYCGAAHYHTFQGGTNLVVTDLLQVVVKNTIRETRVVCEGEIDLWSKTVLEETVKHLINGERNSVIDLYNTNFIDGEGCACLNKIAYTLKPHGKTLKVITRLGSGPTRTINFLKEYGSIAFDHETESSRN